MSASLTIAIAEFVELFRDTWTECEMLRANRALEASGQSVDWERGLKTARAEADELFDPMLKGIRSNHPLTPLLQELVVGIRNAERTHVEYAIARLSRSVSRQVEAIEDRH
jgi:hypothetical protein